MSLDEISDVKVSLDKIETIVKVLNQSMLDVNEFNAKFGLNLCSVLLREIDYTKSKIIKIENSVLS